MSLRIDAIRLSGSYSFLTVTRLCVTNPGFLSVSLFRFQTLATRRGLRILARLISSLNHAITGAEFVLGCDIGPGLIVRHPSGVVIGGGASIGDNCVIMQGTTLGQKYTDGTQLNPGFPQVGHDVTFGAGCVVLGGVRIGSGSTIGALAVVLSDVGERCVAVGNP